MHLAADLLSRSFLTVLRNYTVHTYNEQLADYVYSRLPETARRFRAVLAATVIEGE
jgi:hypothetical protein